MRENHVWQTTRPSSEKTAPIPTELPPFGERGPYYLNLGASATPPTAAPKPKKKTTKTAPVRTSKIMES